MEKNKPLQKQARPGQTALKGTMSPPTTQTGLTKGKGLTAEEALRLKLGDRGPDGPDDRDG